MLRYDAIDHLFPVLSLRDVELDRLDPLAARDLLDVACVDESALFREKLCDRPPNPLRGAADQRYLPFKSAHKESSHMRSRLRAPLRPKIMDPYAPASAK